MHKEQATITVPASFINRLAAAGRLMLELANDLRSQQPPGSRLQRPDVVPKDQEWFWNEKWLAGERAVDEDLAHGAYEEFETIEALLADLHSPK
jgi:hypothetical protein